MNSANERVRSKTPQTAVSPRQIPYSSVDPSSIPALVDDIKNLGEFNMTRLLFFTIDATAAVEDWVAYLRQQETPFLLFGLTPVIHRPNPESLIFTTQEHVSELFNEIEDREGLVVETDHIWLPNFLLEEGTTLDSTPVARETFLMRGAVWRISFDLFQLALKFRHEIIGEKQFLARCRQLRAGPEMAIAYSPAETDVFRRWSATQFDDARKNYLAQREDPRRGVLRYRDRPGQYKAG